MPPRPYKAGSFRARQQFSWESAGGQGGELSLGTGDESPRKGPPRARPLCDLFSEKTAIIQIAVGPAGNGSLRTEITATTGRNEQERGDHGEIYLCAATLGGLYERAFIVRPRSFGGRRLGSVVPTSPDAAVEWKQISSLFRYLYSIGAAN